MEKRSYKTPLIEVIELDNEISLALESAPPAGPDEVNLGTEYFKQEPMHTNNA